MNLLSFCRKVEILFWTSFVRLMKNGRKVRKTLLAGIALLGGGLLLIFLLSWFFSPLSDQVGIETISPEFVPVYGSSTFEEIQPLGNGQTNLLLILVDSLTGEDSALLGIWLIERIADMPQVVFLPIYPNQRSSENESFNRSFELDSDGYPSPQFLEVLRTKNIWWDHFLVVDKLSLSDFIALTGGVAWEGKISAGPEVARSLTELSASPESALRAQARIAGVLCRNAPGLIQNADPELIWGILTHRMRSDLEVEAVRKARHEFTQPGGSPVCEFPTLQELTHRWADEK